MYDYDVVVIGSGPSGRRAERSETIQCHYAVLWIASRSLSPGAIRATRWLAMTI
jgi:pyruvate/2-oxoglutarate dehydrogenase complex dihydrolipoamide dehydrogenase (E3) component